MASVLRLDYSLDEPIGGIRFGAKLIMPFPRVNLTIGSGPGAVHQEKAGLGDIAVVPLVAGWEFETPVGHLTRIIQRGAMRPHDDTGGGVVFCGVGDAGIGV